jgi:uncharacterized protein (TIGR02444 family)
LAQQDSRDSDTDNLQYDNDFWRFSLAVYAQVEVAQECLELQQALGVDVNILLFCAWIGTRSFALSRNDIEAASRTVAVWHENVVRPLRGVRQQIKILYRDEFGSFQASVKGTEIEAEQIEQAILFAYSKRIQGTRASVDYRDAVVQNVKEYIATKSGDATGRASELSAPRLVDAARGLSSSF